MNKIKYLLLLTIFSVTISDANAEQADILKGFTPYASIQANVDYVSKSKEMGANGEKESDFGFAITDAVLGFEYEKENFKSTFELVLADDNLAEVGVAIAEYNFGAYQVLFGLNDSPYTFTSNEASFGANNLVGFGTTTEDAALIQAQFTISGLYLNLMEPNLPQNDDGDNEVISGTTVSDYDVVMPKVAIGYNLETDLVALGIGGAFNTFKINDPSSNIDGESVNSYLAFINAQVTFGAFSLLANFGYSVNPVQFGLTSSVNADAVIVDDSIEDTTMIEGFIEAGYAINNISLIAGVGYVQADNSEFENKDSAMAYYVQAPIEINDHLSIVPEVAVHDYMKDSADADEGSEMSAGLFVEAKY